MSRTQFGKPIAGFQLTQGKLADMLIRVNRAHLLAIHLGKLKDAGNLAPPRRSASARRTTRRRPCTLPERPAACSAPAESPWSTR